MGSADHPSGYAPQLSVQRNQDGGIHCAGAVDCEFGLLASIDARPAFSRQARDAGQITIPLTHRPHKIPIAIGTQHMVPTQSPVMKYPLVFLLLAPSLLFAQEENDLQYWNSDRSSLNLSYNGNNF